MVDDLVEGRGFWGASPVVLEPLLCLLPGVAPEHAGWFGEVRLGVVLELWRIAERDSGEVSGRAMRARPVGMYVRDAAPDSPGEERLAPG